MSLVNQISYKDGAGLDAFGNLKISTGGDRFNSQVTYGISSELYDTIVTTGSSIYFDQNSREAVLQIGTSTLNQRVDLVQHYYNPYTPASGQEIDITGTLNEANISGGSIYFFLKSGISNSTTLYGAGEWTEQGASGFNMNGISWSNSQILFMDFQSLKVGRIRFAMVRDGVANLCHQIKNDNRRNTGYWRYPELPVHWKIENGASYTTMEMGYFDESEGIGLRYVVPVNAGAQLRAICSSVKSQGGPDLHFIDGYRRSIDNMTTYRTVGASLSPVLSIRASNLFAGVTNNAIILPTGFEVRGTNSLRYAILLNPVLTGASWNPVDTLNSTVEYDVASTGVTKGIQVESGYLTTGANTRISRESTLEKVVMSRGYSGNTDILSVVAIKDGANNSDTGAVIDWKEIR